MTYSVFQLPGIRRCVSSNVPHPRIDIVLIYKGRTHAQNLLDTQDKEIVSWM